MESKIKYISINQLIKKIKYIIEEICKYNVEYIVMINKEPKVRISPINNANGKELLIEGQIENSNKLGKFIE